MEQPNLIIITSCLETKYYDNVFTTQERIDQTINTIECVKKYMSNTLILFIESSLSKGKGQLNDGQVFGCEFYPATELKDKVDAYVFLGQSNFHAAGIALSTNMPTYVLDPYFNEVREVAEFAQKLKEKQIVEKTLPNNRL